MKTLSNGVYGIDQLGLMDFKWNNQDVIDLQTFSFNLRVLEQYGIHCLGITVKGSKTFGRASIIVNIPIAFNTRMNLFAVHDYLKSVSHEYHQILSFLPGNALPGLHCSRFQLLLVCCSLSALSFITKWKNCSYISLLTWLLKNFPFYVFSKSRSFRCFLAKSNLPLLFWNVPSRKPLYLHSWRYPFTVDFDNDMSTFHRVFLTCLHVLKGFIFTNKKIPSNVFFGLPGLLMLFSSPLHSFFLRIIGLTDHYCVFHS